MTKHLVAEHTKAVAKNPEGISFAVLGEKPVKLVVDLNEWHRFDRPGVYRPFVLSRHFLRSVAEAFMSPETEGALVGLVEQAEPNVVAVAAQALELHGTAAAEAPLWKRLERLGGLLVSSDAKEQHGQVLHAWTSNRLTLAVRELPPGDVKYDLAQYHYLSRRDLEKKLQQLPRGTVLDFNPYASEQLFQDTRAIVQRAGLTLERAAQR